MVISYFGALNAFLAILHYIPGPVYSFITLGLLVSGGMSLLKFIASL